MTPQWWVRFELQQIAKKKNPTPRILADKGVGFPTEKEDSDGND